MTSRRGKPHPDLYLKAAENLGVAPEYCLALEDSHNGVRAAHAAGCLPIMVPDLLEATDEMRRLLHLGGQQSERCPLAVSRGPLIGLARVRCA